MGKILEARYLNVDFIVEATFDLSPVVEELNGEVTLLWNETNSQSSSFGIESLLTNTKSPSEDIEELLHALDNLTSTSKSLLRRSQRKVFDIGFECGVLESPIDAELSANTVQRITKIESSINIRIYPWVEHPHEG